MKDHGIIFSGPMIRALLGGRKTQTRRLATSPLRRVAVGDRLWVRETWAPLDRYRRTDPGTAALAANGFYAADRGTVDGEIAFWTPSIHMPRAASRITCLVTDVRFQQLQDITGDDAIAEGVSWHARMDGYQVEDGTFYHGSDPRRCYEFLWNSLHGEDSWDKNPQIVAITFTVEQRNIDARKA